MNHPDQKYIQALLDNDQKLIDELYAKHANKIKWMVLKNNGSEADAADIFQEALLSIYKKAHSQEGFVLTCPLDAFLYMICKKKWLNVLRKRSTQQVTNLEDNEYSIGEDTFLLADQCLQHEDRLQLLHEKISELGEACRELLRLSWEGKGMEEVAELLNFTYGYARKKKSECMAKLIEKVKNSPIYETLKW